MDYQKTNNITGWAIFVIATIVYLITLEDTASFWDCGEFIAVSYKLMVPHPPGAPFFLLVGRMFSFLSFGDVTQVAYWINVSSVLSSSFTILFLFWSIVLLGRKLLHVQVGEEVSKEKTLLLMGSGAVGALAYTFSDSFWFSAVEAEVYAMSSFFTAFVVWAILKWELIEDEGRANRWLILIAYMMGLSIGVHLLNLVTIPALGLIYYFKKYPVTLQGILACLGISGFILILVNNFVIPGLPTIAGAFEISFVNKLGLPFGSGALVFGLLFVTAVVAGIWYSAKYQKVVMNTFMLCFAFILIGYSSYSIILIRSSFNPPIDENNPEDIMSFIKYLKREQYGSRPLAHGQYFTAEVVDQEEGEEVYTKGKEKYEVTDHKTNYEYNEEHLTILPRMYSASPQHIQKYKEVTGYTEEPLKDRFGNIKTKRNGDPQMKPPKFFRHNLYFMFKYQMGHMYWRYFMWNFSGRESDINGADWQAPWDALKEVPQSLKENGARNNFFMIPLLLGIIGLIFQYLRDPKNFAVVAMLFFLTGLVLTIYLNSPPMEPRERDYIYVGSFYAFAIWIGFSVLGLAELLGRVFKNNGKAAAMTATGLCMLAPIIMAAEGWDDHDRSNRYFSVDSAKNFLASCQENAIIFTGGDNDTFPLWYSQDVEGYRTDVRVVVLSYFNTDWYIDQMSQQAYESAPFPFTLKKENYIQGGRNDILFYQKMVNTDLDLKQYINLIKKNDNRLLVYNQYNAVPSKTLTLKIDKDAVRKMGIVPPGMDSLLVDEMKFTLKGSNLEKKDLMILDIIATNDWKRPIYFNNTSLAQVKLNLRPYTIQEGNAYRLLPIKMPEGQQEFVNSDLMFENMTENFHYRELDNPNVYYTEDYRDFVANHRSSFNTLGRALMDEGKKEKAKKALFFNLEKMPDEAIPYDVTSLETMRILYTLDETEKANEIATTYGDRINEELEYSIAQMEKNGYSPYDIGRHLQILTQLQRTAKRFGATQIAKKYEEAIRGYYGALQINERGAPR